MARHSLSNFRRPDGAARLLLLAMLLAGVLTACAGWRDDAVEWPTGEDGVVRHYLTGLREYLAQPAGKQAAHRERLRVAAERGHPAATLEYALTLSVDRDNRANLERARALFESLLVAPDPLPVALDVLVRLQLGQVIDRIGRMQLADDLRAALRGGRDDLKTCLADLHEAETLREDMRRQLSEVRRKLDALARIEQTVNGGGADDGQQGNNDSDDNGENDDAERQPDTARR